MLAWYKWCSTFICERIQIMLNMMTSSNVNIFRVTGPSWGESTGGRWILLTKTSDAELWCFIWSAPEQTPQQAIETPVIWDVIVLVMTSLKWIFHHNMHRHVVWYTYIDIVNSSNTVVTETFAASILVTVKLWIIQEDGTHKKRAYETLLCK